MFTAASAEKNPIEKINNSLKNLQQWLSYSESLAQSVEQDIAYSGIFIKSHKGHYNYGEYFQVGNQQVSLDSDLPQADYQRRLVASVITGGSGKISTWLSHGLIISSCLLEEAKKMGNGLAFSEDPEKALAWLKHLDPSPHELRRKPELMAVLAANLAVVVKSGLQKQMESSVQSSPKELAERLREVNGAFKPLQNLVDDSRLISGIVAANSTLQAAPRLTNVSQMPSVDERVPVVLINPVQFDRAA